MRWRAHVIWRCLGCGHIWFGRTPPEYDEGGSCGLSWRWDLVGDRLVPVRHPVVWSLIVVADAR